MLNHRSGCVFFLLTLIACGEDFKATDFDDAQAQALVPAPSVVVAVIGDYGTASVAERQVAQLVAGFRPDFIVTTGDNNYPEGALSTLDNNIGHYYHSYIAFGPTYRGRYRHMGASKQAFFPTLGNHDWMSAHAAPYLHYFDLPGNKRYYRVSRGPIEFFMLDSDPHEPDGITPASRQGRWLKAALSTSTARWKVVAFHHPPYSTGVHGSSPHMRWPFAAWGAHLVLSGHDHHYERIQKQGFPYIVVGTGGAPLRQATGHHPGCEIDVICTRAHGALRIEADAESLTANFYNTAGARIDGLRLADEAPQFALFPQAPGF